MTFHFAAILPERGIGIVSDSVVSFQRGDGSWSLLEHSPKTFVINENAAIACAGHGPLCLAIVAFVAEHAPAGAVFSHLAPLVQKAYLASSVRHGNEPVELLLAARTRSGHAHMRLIKFVMKQNGLGLRRIEPRARHHYTAGLELPLLEQELCRVLTINYQRTYGMERAMKGFIDAANHIVRSPKSFPLGICMASLSGVVADYVRHYGLADTVGSPWTALLMPEDGPIHFTSSAMYDGTKTIQPGEILGLSK